MPRTCLACASPNRAFIDKALAVGAPLRTIADHWSVSKTALIRHKKHVAVAIVKAQERREERVGESSLDEMRKIQQKIWEILAKMEAEGDHRGVVVALREAREAIESLEAMLALAGASSEMVVRIVHIGAKDESGKGQDALDHSSNAPILAQSNQ